MLKTELDYVYGWDYSLIRMVQRNHKEAVKRHQREVRKAKAMEWAMAFKDALLLIMVGFIEWNVLAWIFR